MSTFAKCCGRLSFLYAEPERFEFIRLRWASDQKGSLCHRRCSVAAVPFVSAEITAAIQTVSKLQSMIQMRTNLTISVQRSFLDIDMGTLFGCCSFNSVVEICGYILIEMAAGDFKLQVFVSADTISTYVSELEQCVFFMYIFL